MCYGIFWSGQFCMSIVFKFSWDGCNTQEKWKTKAMQIFFFFFGGGGVNKVHYGKCGGWRIFSYSPPSPHGAFEGY